MTDSLAPPFVRDSASRPGGLPSPRPPPPGLGRCPTLLCPRRNARECEWGRLAPARGLLSIPSPEPPGLLSPSQGATAPGALPSLPHLLGRAGCGSGCAGPSAPGGRRQAAGCGLRAASVRRDRARLRWRRPTVRGGPRRGAGPAGEGRAPRLSFMQRGGVRDPDARAAPAHLAEGVLASESAVRRRGAPWPGRVPPRPRGRGETVPRAELGHIGRLPYLFSIFACSINIF